MDFGMEASIFLAYTACLMVIYFFGKLLLVPAKIILKLVVSSIIGGAILLVLNHIGNLFDIFVPLNIITAAITGIAGIPGLAAILVYFNFIA